MMRQESVLGKSKLVAFVPTTNPEKARKFYEEILGLRLVSDEPPFALVFDANGTMLRVTSVSEHTAALFTVLGWEVDDVVGVVEQLGNAGVEFIRYPGLNETDPHGIWTAPGGAQVAWFRDPEGNILSITKFPPTSQLTSI
jgi:catechol 2,3-dioxygenase-like lactoylglutathione lyase family enzyme